MSGVDSEQGGHPDAPPKTASESPQKREEENDIRDVQNQIGDVMTNRLQPIQLDIGHVRNPSERMPIARMEFLKRPENALRGKPAPHHVVRHDVFPVIINQEIAPEDRDEGQAYQRNKSQATKPLLGSSEPREKTRHRHEATAAVAIAKAEIAAEDFGSAFGIAGWWIWV